MDENLIPPGSQILFESILFFSVCGGFEHSQIFMYVFMSLLFIVC